MVECSYEPVNFEAEFEVRVALDGDDLDALASGESLSVPITENKALVLEGDDGE